MENYFDIWLSANINRFGILLLELQFTELWMNGSKWLNELNEKNYSISAHTQAEDKWKA